MEKCKVPLFVPGATGAPRTRIPADAAGYLQTLCVLCALV